ncbi:MAG TPA: hypothetical protein VFI60_03040, partial [Candidatus Acidoferrum sp.]|nr:hypothetical protein [Candidatus Acidoferrum sp.]
LWSWLSWFESRPRSQTLRCEFACHPEELSSRRSLSPQAGISPRRGCPSTRHAVPFTRATVWTFLVVATAFQLDAPHSLQTPRHKQKALDSIAEIQGL